MNGFCNRKVLPALAVVALGLGLLGGCGTGDRLIVPTPREDSYVGLQLTCLNVISKEDVVLGGFLTPLDGGLEGILLQTENGGQTWRRIGAETFPFDGFLVQAIHFNDALRGWVSGIRLRRGETIPAVLGTDDGGEHWREYQIPESRASVVSHVSEVHFKTDHEGILYVAFYEEDSDEPVTNIYETRDGGRNWVIKDFAQSADAGLTDPAEMYFTEKQAYRIESPLVNGTQILSFTGTGGKTWVPVSQFHVSQLSQYYGYDNDSDAPDREENRAEKSESDGSR